MNSNDRKTQAVLVKIIWGALLASNAMLLFVSHFLKPESIAQEGVPAPSVLKPEIFYALALVSLMASQIIPKIIGRALNPAGESLATDSRNEDGTERALSPKFFSALFTPMIIELALLESISLYGFILGYVQGRLDLHRAFFLVAVFFTVRAFPASFEKMSARYLGRS